jgi:DHA1 family multidrug resistance protein-like MFS transporter
MEITHNLRITIMAILTSTTFVTTFASGIYAPAIQTIAKDYDVAPEVATLGVTLYVLGFSFG